MSPSMIVTLPEAIAGLEILAPSASEIVQDHDLLEALRDQSIGDMGADQSCAAGNQRSSVIHAKCHFLNECARACAYGDWNLPVTFRRPAGQVRPPAYRTPPAPATWSSMG